MPRLISQPSRVEAAGMPPKRIDEYVGLVNTGDDAVSLARMTSPCGWVEPGQRPKFRELTLVLRGGLRVETETETFEVGAGQAIVVEPGEWVRYSTPHPEGAEYVAICLPAFRLDLAQRDPEIT